MAGDASRSLPTPFLTKTYQLVDDREIDEIISWNEDGSTFVVWNPTEFARDLLPKYFKHNNFSSFVRQLNTYGFRKVVPDRWEFSNECFRRGEKKLLCDIQRRKVCSQISSPSPCTAAAGGAPPPSAVTTPPPPPPPFPRTLSPSDSGDEQVISTSNSAREFTGTTAELIGENERLRKENVQLSKELTQMKSLCNNIYALMSNYKSSDDGADRHRQAQGPNCKLRPLDLLPMTSFCREMKLGSPDPNGVDENNSIKCAAEEISARLFGVPIGGVKRGRESDGTGYSSSEDAMMTTMDLQLQQPGGDAVKSEPLDVDEEMDGVDRQMVEDEEEMTWLARSGSSRNQRVCN